MNKTARRVSQAGFTLIELMVSLAIGLLIVLALVALLVNVNRNNGELNKTNRVIENGRVALQLLQADIVHAGFLGGFIPQFDDLIVATAPIDYPSAVPDPCLAYTTPWTTAHVQNLFGIAVQSYEIPATVPSPTLSVCANKVVSPKANTDVLFVRHADNSRNCLTAVAGCPLPKLGELYLQMARCGSSVPSPAYTFAPYVSASAVVDFRMKNRKCNMPQNMPENPAGDVLEDLWRFGSSLYYIRNFAVTAGDGIPTLMRSKFGFSPAGLLDYMAPEALIEGIEGFRVELGVDDISDSGAAVNLGAAITWGDSSTKLSPTNRGDGVPDGAYIRCTTAVPCTVAQLANVVALKLYVLVRSDLASPGYADVKTYAMGSTSLGPFNDRFKRHLFTQTVRMTNISSRRETP